MLLSSKRITQFLITVNCAALLAALSVIVANAQTARNVELSDFSAMLGSRGVDVEWHATGASVDWQFTIYRSQSCQFEEAEEVAAPIFSSINDETQTAHYSLTDIGDTVVATCAYWLVATEGRGEKQNFGPYSVQGRTTVYLPLALQ